MRLLSAPASVLALLLALPLNGPASAQEAQPDKSDKDPAAALEVLPKIFRGTAAIDGQFPFHSAIGIKFGLTGSYSYHCGATMVAPRWLVSASHCFKKGPSGERFRAAIGGITHGDFSDAVPVDQIFVYQRAPEQAAYLGDIALLRLRQDAPARAASIALQDEAEFEAAGHERREPEYTILGFGPSSVGANPVIELQFADGIPAQSSSRCRELKDEIANELIFGDRVVADTICAGDDNDPLGSDACKGDSGGGLIYYPSGGAPVLAGIVSGGTKVNDFGCNTHRIKVGLYTRIAGYHDQITACIASPEDTACRFVPMKD